MALFSRKSKLINILKNKENGKELYYALKDIKSKAKTWYPEVTFPGWTYHCDKHVDEVERLLNHLIPDRMKRAMTADEIFVLLAACYWHDFGMRFGEKHRPKHNVLSRNSLYDIENHRDTKEYIIFPNPSHVYAKTVASLCLAHRDHREGKRLVKTLAMLNVKEKFPKGSIHLQTLGCLLRLADELDLTQQRFPARIYDDCINKYNEFLSRHFLVRQVEIDSDTFEINIHVDEEILPHFPTANKILKTVKNKVKLELNKIHEKLKKTTEKSYKIGYRDVEIVWPTKKVEIKRKQIIECIMEETDLSENKAKCLLKAFEDSLISALKRGESVTLVGFGTFSAAKRKARTARNPRTGEAIHVPPRKTPKFKAGRELKKAVK